MKTSLAIAVALVAGVGTSVYAQTLIKQDKITLALTLQGQASVSTSATAANAGNFSQGPLFYKTSTSKFTQVNVLKAIAYVLHSQNAGYYTSAAELELVQGELGGFFNISDTLAQSFPTYYSDASITGSFNDDGEIGFNPYINNDFSSLDIFGDGALPATFFPTNGQYGFDITGTLDFSNVIVNAIDLSARTSIADGQNMFAALDTGRHFLPVPWASYDFAAQTGTPYATTGHYPPGHMQPWGQIYVKDPGHKDSSGNPLCENVTFFFDLEVQECYDCFYLNSFITDAQFKNNNGTQSGPPCCTVPAFLTGKGTDKYYLTLDFDNTVNNSYLNPARTDIVEGNYVYAYSGFTGVIPSKGQTSGNFQADGLTPDLLPYSDPIRSHLGVASPYETRFTLKGIVTYNWTLKLINQTDIASDFIGTATYACNGYGFIGLVCDLITGSATFAETAVKDIGCCDDETWYDQTFNSPSFNGEALGTDNEETWVIGWFGPGWDGSFGYFNPDNDVDYQYNPFPHFNIVGGEVYNTDEFIYSLPYQFESPFNPPAALTRHQLDIGSSSIGYDDPIWDNYIIDFGSFED